MPSYSNLVRARTPLPIPQPIRIPSWMLEPLRLWDQVRSTKTELPEAQRRERKAGVVGAAIGTRRGMYAPPSLSSRPRPKTARQKRGPAKTQAVYGPAYIRPIPPPTPAPEVPRKFRGTPHGEEPRGMPLPPTSTPGVPEPYPAPTPAPVPTPTPPPRWNPYDEWGSPFRQPWTPRMERPWGHVPLESFPPWWGPQYRQYDAWEESPQRYLPPLAPWIYRDPSYAPLSRWRRPYTSYRGVV